MILSSSSTDKSSSSAIVHDGFAYVIVLASKRIGGFQYHNRKPDNRQ
jgi:hypothetical protein